MPARLRPADQVPVSLPYATVVFGAVIHPGTGFAGSAGSLALLLYGGISTLNDVADLESDRLHPSKRRRPIASGAISEEAAVSFALLLILISACAVPLLSAFLVLDQRPSARQRCSGTPREPLSAHSSPYTMETGREDERHAVP